MHGTIIFDTPLVIFGLELRPELPHIDHNSFGSQREICHHRVHREFPTKIFFFSRCAINDADLEKLRGKYSPTRAFVTRICKVTPVVELLLTFMYTLKRKLNHSSTSQWYDFHVRHVFWWHVSRVACLTNLCARKKVWVCLPNRGSSNI